MTAFIYHFVFEFKAGLRNQSSMLMNYLFPLSFYALIGFVMTKINPGFANVLLPAMTFFSIMTGTLLGLPMPLVAAREAGVYRSYKINGVPALSILSIPALAAVFHALIASAIIALTANILFGGRSPDAWWSFAALVLVIAIVFSAIGALIGVVAADSRSVVLLSQLIFLPSMILGGLMIPSEMLPRSVRTISGLLPSTYAMQIIRAYAYHQKTMLDPRICLGILLSSGILAFGLAVYLFNWDTKNTARRGRNFLALLALTPFVMGVFLMQK